MKNISKELFTYLEAKRHLWNTYFIGKVKSLRECSELDEYEYIDRLLFKALVLRSIKRDFPSGDNFVFGVGVLPFIKATPKFEIEQTEILIWDTQTKHRQWKPLKLKWSKNLTFSFIEFFEWNRYEYVSYPLCQLKIERCKEHPEIVGWYALVENSHLEFYFDQKVKVRA